MRHQNGKGVVSQPVERDGSMTLQIQDNWDRLVAELQHEIDEKERALYSAKVLEQARNPTHLGRMEDPDAYARITGRCGDTMEIFLRCNGSTIQQATFLTDGCGSRLACGNMITTMVVGKTPDEAAQIDPEELTAALGGLPDDSAHCAVLAVSTLRKALASVPRPDATGAT